MTRVTLRLPDELHRRLREVTQQTGSSLNQVIVATLSEALAANDTVGEEKTPVAELVQQIRAILGDAAVELDISKFPPHLRPRDDLPDTDILRQSMPVLVPPLSATIIADREERF